MLLMRRLRLEVPGDRPIRPVWSRRQKPCPTPKGGWTPQDRAERWSDEQRALWFRARKLSGSASREHEDKALPTLTSSPCSCGSHLTLATLASTVLPVPRRNVPPPGLAPRRSPASRSVGLARRLWLRLAERRRWPSL